MKGKIWKHTYLKLPQSISTYLFLDHPDLEQIDPAVLKYCHAAAATCIAEAGKQGADKSAIRYSHFKALPIFFKHQLL